MNSKEVEEEIEKKREQYQSSLQPLYRQCRKNEVSIYIYIYIYISHNGKFFFGIVQSIYLHKSFHAGQVGG